MSIEQQTCIPLTEITPTEKGVLDEAEAARLKALADRRIFDAKAILERTPSFRPSDYGYLDLEGNQDSIGLSKDVESRDRNRNTREKK